MSDADYDGWDDDNECWNCGGEGRVNDCIDGCCVDQDNIYCPYCSKRCDVCNPPTKKQRGTPLTGKARWLRTRIPMRGRNARTVAASSRPTSHITTTK